MDDWIRVGSDKFEFVSDEFVWHFDGSFKVEYNWVDFGIGGYDIGDRRLFDSRMGAEELTVTELEIEGLTKWVGDNVVDEQDVKEVDDELKAKVIAALQAAIDECGKFSDDVHDELVGDLA